MSKFDFEQAKREAKIRYDDLCKLLMNEHYVDFVKRLYPYLKSSPDRVLRANTVDFFLYIAKANGEISDSETTLIGYITGWRVTKEFLNDFVKENFIFEDDYQPALITNLVCYIENVWATVDGDDRGIVRLLVKLFNLISDLALHLNGKANKQAKKNAKKYLKVNFKYIRNNVKCPSNKGIV